VADGASLRSGSGLPRHGAEALRYFPTAGARVPERSKAVSLCDQAHGTLRTGQR
jgi:hypothetical protein